MREPATNSTSASQEKVGYELAADDGNVTRLERELDLEREERRELAVENRRLYREKEQLLREKEELLRENGNLREKLARFEAEHGKRISDHDDEENFPGLFDEQRSITSSNPLPRVHK